VTCERTVSIAVASEADAAELSALRTEVAEQLTRRHGQGHWSALVTERGERRSLKTTRIIVARDVAADASDASDASESASAIVGTFRLGTKKPWAIDTAYFTDVARPLYLTDMAVAPPHQRQGVGRRLIEEAKEAAAAWPADALRLDAYDHAAGAGAFYAKCGFRQVGRVTYRGVPLLYFEWMVARHT
jgi:GNAT superfamily N-acetyltransferase